MQLRLNPTPYLSHHLVAQNVLREQPFSLVDVGASGGIAEHWNTFGTALRAVGFDPLVSEVDRLNAAEPNPAVRYVAAFVGCRDLASPGEVFSLDFHNRTSSVRAQELLRCDYTSTYYDQTHEGTVTVDVVELDEYLAANPMDVDFVKVDTDTSDMAVLLGASKLLAGAGPVALALETNLVEVAYPNAHVLINVGAYLQGLGYSLFALDPRLYTRAALPRVFRWSGKPADTFAGQVRWADTLFCRDVCIPGYEARFGVNLTPHKLLKLCCAFELYGLEDCAAEVLLTFRDRLKPVVDVDRCLDLLTPPLPNGHKVSYREYIEVFEKNVGAFYPEAGERLTSEELRAQLEKCEFEVAELRYALQNSVALKLARSMPWLLAPLRRLLRFE